MSTFTKQFGIFTAKYTSGSTYINVFAMGVEVDVINISHIEGPTITRKQFLEEVKDSKDYIVSAYSIDDIRMLAGY